MVRSGQIGRLAIGRPIRPICQFSPIGTFCPIGGQFANWQVRKSDDLAGLFGGLSYLANWPIGCRSYCDSLVWVKITFYDPKESSCFLLLRPVAWQHIFCYFSHFRELARCCLVRCWLPLATNIRAYCFPALCVLLRLFVGKLSADENDLRLRLKMDLTLAGKVTN